MPRVVEPSAESIAEAAQRLRDGQLVAFPTETVYGLGADTFNERAIEAIYRAKGRPLDNPLIAHVAGMDEAADLLAGDDEDVSALAARFWPGPLTLVVPKPAAVPSVSTGGRPTIAIRAPSHPVARRLLTAFGGPVSAPSANRSGHVSPTTAQHVAADFPDLPDLLILDGGPARIGLESTVLDLTVRPPAILRPGAVDQAAISTVIGSVATPWLAGQAASPGTAPRHYAPSTPSEIVDAAALASRLAASTEPAIVLAFDAAGVNAPHRAIVMPGDASGYARRIYAALREADAAGARRILIVRPPADGDLWTAVLDRLRRATGAGPG